MALQGLFTKLLLFVSIIAAMPVSAFADTGRPNPEQGPTQVQVEVFLLDLDSIDSAAQSFDANVYFEATWEDPRLADTTRGYTVTLPLDQIWHPRLQILSQQRIWSSLPDIVAIKPDGTVTQRARVWGSFSQPLDLSEFPFDTQTISIQVVAAGYGPEQVALSSNPSSGIGDAFSVADWKTMEWRMTTDLRIPGPDEAQNPSIALLLVVERLTGYYWIKVIAPLILIVAMSWAVFWIDPKDTGTKVSISITAMLTLIAYRFAIGASLPAISYLTRMDLFILFSTILVYASLVAVVLTATYARKRNTGLATRIDTISRWGFPLFFIASAVVTMTMQA